MATKKEVETFDVGDLVICPWPHKNGVGIVLAVEETTSNIISLEVLINETKKFTITEMTKSHH